MLEEYYAQKDEKFQEFVECFAFGKTDEGLGELIQKLYEMAMSNPFPEEWLEKCLDEYRVESLEELRQTEWMKLLWSAVLDELKEAELLVQEARRICEEADGPYLYEEALNSDLLLIRRVKEAAEKKEYNEMAGLLRKPAFARLSTKKAPDVEEQKKQRVKELREEEKGILKELGQRYFQGTEEEILEILQYTKAPVEMLVELTIRFKEQFGDAKREKNILDFTDMEHFALQILMTKEGEELHMSQAARELSARYDEVLVDEYQDSNYVQELLTTGVSGWINQRKNIFMVGDVKQSIYVSAWRDRSFLWKSIKAIRQKKVRNRGLTFTKISEAGRRCWRVSILFSGRSWERTLGESVMTGMRLFIRELFFRRGNRRSL